MRHSQSTFFLMGLLLLACMGEHASIGEYLLPADNDIGAYGGAASAPQTNGGVAGSVLPREQAQSGVSAPIQGTPIRTDQGGSDSGGSEIPLGGSDQGVTPDVPLCVWPLEFADPDVEQAVRVAIFANGGREAILDEQGPISLDDAQKVEDLDVALASSVAGVQCLPELRSFAIRYYAFGDVDEPPADLSLLNEAPHLESVSVYAHSQDQVDSIAPLTRISRLLLDAQSSADLSVLTSLTQLRSLDLIFSLDDPQIVDGPTTQLDISTLASLSNLTDLAFGAMSQTPLPFEDLSVLRSMPTLQSVRLHGIKISDLSPLLSLPNLTNLSLAEDEGTDVSVVASLTQLERLDLSLNRLLDLPPITSLSNLIELNLSGNRISDISSLRPLTALEALNLDDNRIADITPIAGLTKLRELQLSGNVISDVSALDRLTMLTLLDISANSIANISGFASYTDVSSFTAIDNDITDISALAGWSKLSDVNLSNNRISDLSPLSGLTHLNEVILRQNLVSEVASLAANPGFFFKYLDLRNNPIDCANQTAAIVILDARGHLRIPCTR